jgi:hypothetical protein
LDDRGFGRGPFFAPSTILVPMEVLDWPRGRQYIPAKESGLGNWIEVHAGIRDGVPAAHDP